MRAEQRAETIRAAAWAGIGMFVVVRAIIALAPLEPLAEVVASDVLTYLLPILIATVACWTAAYRIKTDVEGRFWTLLASATSLMLIVETHWTWYTATVDFHGPPLNTPIRILYAVAAGLLFGLVLTMTRFGERSLARRMRFYVDSLAGIVVGFACFYIARQSGSTDPVSIANEIQLALYPVAGLTLLIAVGAVLQGWKAYPWRSWERLTVGSLAIMSIGLAITPLWYEASLEAVEPTPGWIALVFGSGVYLLAIAAVYRLTAAPEEALLEPWPVPLAGRSPAWRVYPVVLAAFLPIVGWYALALEATPFGMPLLVAAALLAVLLVARSWFSALEIAHHRLSAVTDDVTGAYNERYLRARLDELISGVSGYDAALVLFEIADYTRITEAMGRAASDGALRQLADTLISQSPPGAEVFRLGGGRMAALLPETTLDVCVGYAASVIVRESRRATGLPALNLFAGVASFPDHALDSEGLLACARAAVQSARDADEGHVAVYDDVHSGSRREPGGIDLRALRETVRALAAAVDARDPATRHHSANCAELATALARRLGLDEEQVQLIGLAALMHDVGKIGVSDAILLKPGPLTDDEHLAVQEHCELGQRILQPANMGDILPLVRHHHERWDGSGYPDALSGEEIPLEARIMAVCDTFETMTAGRPYRMAVSTRRALDEIEACAGTQFDPAVSRAFVAMMEAQTEVERRKAFRSRPDLATGDSTG